MSDTQRTFVLRMVRDFDVTTYKCNRIITGVIPNVRPSRVDINRLQIRKKIARVNRATIGRCFGTLTF